MKKLLTHLILLAVVAALPIVAAAQTGTLPRTSPEQQGISSAAVARFIDSLMAVKSTHIHHVMVVRHGTVVAEVHPAPFRASDVHTLYSESKTFTCMAVGLAVDEGKIKLDDKVVKFFPDKLPANVSTELKAMTVRDLLTMRSGIKPDWVMRNWSTDWMRIWLGKPVVEPGKKFQYDSMCTFMLSAIVQRATGHTVLELLKQRLFGPMGITVADWEQSPDGVNTGGWGLRLQAESQAKLGILLLNGGKWQGKQLISRKWVEEATAKQVDFGQADKPATDGNQGYGFQLWRGKWPGSYRADGAYGQFIVCVPEVDLVVVINGLSYRGDDEMACVWRQLMPGISKNPLAPNAASARALRSAISRAKLPMLKGQRVGMVPPANGQVLPATGGLSSVKPIATGKSMRLVVRYADFEATDTIALGFGSWARTTLKGRTPYSIQAQSRFKGLTLPLRVAGNYAWLSPTKLVVQLYYVNMISRRLLTFDFKNHTLTVWDSFDHTKHHKVAWK